MIARLLVAGAVWLTAIALFAAGLVWSGRPRPRERPTPATALARALSPRAETDAAPSWFVTRATSAHHMLVVDIEAEHPDDADTIAKTIVTQSGADRYEEILIYVRRVGEGNGMGGRRVQWTPAAGYVATVLGD